MAIEITPEPSEGERRAISAALDVSEALSPAYVSRWRAAALDDLRDGTLTEESWGDAGVVKP